MLDDFFDAPFAGYDNRTTDLMKTDIKDTENGYEVTMNLPGVKKEDVKAELKDGYLTLSAAKGLDNGCQNDRPDLRASILCVHLWTWNG